MAVERAKCQKKPTKGRIKAQAVLHVVITSVAGRQRCQQKLTTASASGEVKGSGRFAAATNTSNPVLVMCTVVVTGTGSQ